MFPHPPAAASTRRAKPAQLAVALALRLALVLCTLLLVGAPARAQSPDPAPLKRFLAQVKPSEVVPGADRYGPVREAPLAASAYRGDTLVGHVFLNSDHGDANGYSGKPIHILVGMDTEGTIVGLRLVEHSEPIVLIGIPERRVVDYLAAFVGYNPVRAAAAGRGPPRPDIVSGATVTVLVMGESVVRAAVRVQQALQSGAAPGAAAAAPAAPKPEVDPQAGSVADWPTLLKEGAIAHLHLTVGQVNQAFEASGNAAAAKRPEPGPPEAPFIDLYTALVSQPAIGRSLLGEDGYATLSNMLAPGQHAIVVAGSGTYSFKGSGYVRGGIFDRIELIQGTETIRFRDREHRRIGSLAAAGAPPLREIGVFLVPQGARFDAAAPWRLQLLVQRATGALDKAFVSFDLPYELPARYIKGAPAPDGATPGPLPDAEGERPLWERIWYSKVAAIAMLAAMLAALTFVFFFQDWLMKRERLYDRVRLAYLALTLVWLGWVAQAQLSVVNVLTFTTALRTGFEWSAFLVDPLIFLLWCSVAAALLFWGRGPFCGWLCPFGALQELTNRAARALKVPQLKVPWSVHERAITVKYIVFLALFGVSLGSLALAEKLSEVEPFKTAIVLRFMREWWFVAFALALLAAGLFIERFFCRYLCPLGAALAIPGRLRIFEWLKRYRECGNPCMRCFNECPVEAIHPEGHINPNECIGCLHCQMLYHHEYKCPVMIQRRLKHEKRVAMASRPAPGTQAPETPVIPIQPAKPA